MKRERAGVAGQRRIIVARIVSELLANVGCGLRAFRHTIGVMVELAFIVYVVAQGRDAVARGVTGLIGDTRPRWVDEGTPVTT